MPERRYSSNNNDELSLEQRLVMQLSAAIHQDESGDAPSENQNNTSQRRGSVSLQQDRNININDLSGLLGSIGNATTTGLQDSSFSFNMQNSQHHGYTTSLPANQNQMNMNLGKFNDFSNSFDAASQFNASNINANELLSSLQGNSSNATSSAFSNLSNLNLSNSNFGNLKLGDFDLHNLSTLEALGASSSGSSTTKVNEDPKPLALANTNLNIGNISGIPGVPPQPASTDQSLPSVTPSTTRSLEVPHPLHDNIATPIPTTSIDPDVSSIQSVLQLLLTSGSSNGLTDSTTSSALPSNAAAVDTPTVDKPVPPQQSSTDNALAEPSSKVDFNSLFGLGLGAEDQNLIESLKNAINLTSTSSSDLSTSSHLRDFSSPHTEATFTGRVSKPRLTTQKPKSKPKSTMPLSEHSHVSSSPRTNSFQSDFNASDPDTLRAIQQALLSALGPSAASTSLAESLTNSSTSSPFEEGLQKRNLNLPTTSRTQLNQPSQASESGFARRTGSSSLDIPASKPHLNDISLGKVNVPRTSKQPLKFPLSKVVKPVESDRQRQREENAARKRKWRELNHLQNRDKDLRLRIVKRAHELYGEQDTKEKSAWIEQEFNRRRHRRILRAGIHSIVESARARALQAQERGTFVQNADHPQLRPGSRTLTQQSKQAASSHLSQLFRSSNAALEPRLQNEKLPVPLAPYMLVASPKRPPFKLNSTSPLNPNEIIKLGDKSEANETPKEGSNALNCRPNNADVAQESLENNGTESSRSSQTEPPHTSNPTMKTDFNDGSKSDHINTNGEEFAQKQDTNGETTKITVKPPTSTTDKGIDDERPKHRYALIGDIKLGVPPNLTSIYRKIRGAVPFKMNLSQEHHQRVN